MAEIMGLGASIIAIIQIADRVIGLCKFFLETVHDAPSDLRVILIETSTMKAILENLKFLVSCNNEQSKLLDGLSGPDGPIQGCQSTIEKMETLFQSSYSQGSVNHGSKRQKMKASLVNLAWPLRAEKAKKLVEELNKFKVTINLALTAQSIHDIKDIRSQTSKVHEILSDSQRDKVYQWLQVTEPTDLHHRACKQYESGTGNWMLRSPEWKKWLDGKTRCIWIYGIPGAGKTVLASYLIKNIEKHYKIALRKKRAYVYYYCYFGHNQEEAGPFLRWTINQLCRQAKLVPENLNELYERGRQPSIAELLYALEAILDAFDYLYLVVDAIDESIPRDDMLRVLRVLATDSRFQKVQLLVTSRQYIDIEKVMEPISVPVSMMSSLLDEDIKLYIESALRTNSKFQHWPQSLLSEVLEVVSGKAKGMFRWAACQIHALEHLKADTKIVRKALANLPKTLDETYERIFLAIPDEDRIVVHYALKWIYYNQELWDESISCPTLLQAIEQSIYQLTSAEYDRHLDEEVLRELCGCLIIVTPEYYRFEDKNFPIRTVSFAHYSVWEFLNSIRILDTPAVFFNIIREKTKMELTRFIIHKVLELRSNDLQDSEYHYSVTDEFEVTAFPINFDIYSIISSIISMKRLGYELSQQDELANLTHDLLDPSRPHFSYLKKVASFFDFHIYGKKGFHMCIFSGIEWNTPSKSSETALLTRVLLVDKTCELARKFMRQINIQEVLQIQLDIDKFPIFTLQDCPSWYEFRGTIIELFAEMYSKFPKQFRFLLELGTSYFNPSTILLSFLTSRGDLISGDDRGLRPNEIHREDDHILSKLLHLGASVNGSGYKVTPLQIAVYNADFKAVNILLEAGADPNSAGDNRGMGWEPGTYLSCFNMLHGLSPLEICGITFSRGGKIKKILFQYGAEPRSEYSSETD